MEHLFEKLKKYALTDYYPYHMPGHKRRISGEMPEQLSAMDITEIDGFDNLHHPEGVLRVLQEKAASLYGAEESFYLINGSTCGILSAVSAALLVGGHILMARNCHKSAYHAAYLRNLRVSYLYPPLIEDYDINDAISPEQIRIALDKEPDIGAVLLVSPTYEGRITDVERIASIVHEKGIPLIIDEAHGAHLGWERGFGTNSCQAGADLVIHSVHKTLPAMTQTALLHVNGERIDRDRLQRFLHIYQSSSPSYVLMASIDNALDLMERDGNRLFGEFVRQYDQMMDKLSACKHLKFLMPEEGKQDVGKLVISAKKFGLSGQRIYDILLKEYHLQTEMAAGSYCLAMFTVGDSAEAYGRMTDALLHIDRQMDTGILKPDIAAAVTVTSMEEDISASIPLGQAWDMVGEIVSPKEAVGRYVGEFIYLYPPGVPLLVPGEMMTKEKYRRIVTYANMGLNVHGLEEISGNRKIKVLKRSKENYFQAMEGKSVGADREV